jgi:hypothetical protein
MGTVDKGWHDKHVLGRSARMAERIGWHREHQEACGCRPIPASVRAAVEQSERRTADG